MNKAVNLSGFDSERTAPQKNGGNSIVFLLTVKSSVPYINSSCTVRQGLEKMRRYGCKALPVIHPDGSYAGMVSEGDFLWHVIDTGCASLRQLEKHPLTDLLLGKQCPPVSIRSTVFEIIDKFDDRPFIPVVDDRNTFMGVVTKKSLMLYLSDMGKTVRSSRTM